VSSAFPFEDTEIRSLEVLRAMSCDALATPGTAAKAAPTATRTNAARRSERAAAESGRAP
jgi:hypothetical protein